MALPVAILIFLFIFLMLFGANLVVVGLHHIVKKSAGKVFALSAVILAVATSFPEMSLAITSGFSGKSALSLGNVMGANIANLSLVVGGAAIVAGGVKFQGGFLKKELILGFFSGIFPVVLMYDGILSRLDGSILILSWIAYVVHFFKIRFIGIAEKILEEGSWHGLLHKIHVNTLVGKEWAKLLIGVIILLLSAEIIVY